MPNGQPGGGRRIIEMHAAVRSVTRLFVIVNVSLLFIGVSADQVNKYAMATTAMDGFPSYPCAPDTNAGSGATSFFVAVRNLNATLHEVGGFGRPRMGFNGYPDLRIASYVSIGGPPLSSITLAEDRSVFARVRFLDQVRLLAQSVVLNEDSAAYKAHKRLVADGVPSEDIDVEERIEASGPDDSWHESHECRVLITARVARQLGRAEASHPAWADSFTITVPVDSAYWAALWQMSEAMEPYYREQQYLKASRGLVEWHRWSEYGRVLLRPLSLPALASVDSLRQVMLEVADMPPPDARRYLDRALLEEEQRSRIGVLGLTFPKAVAGAVIPIVYMVVCAFMWLLIVRLKEMLRTSADAHRLSSWPAMFPGWKGRAFCTCTWVIMPTSCVAIFVLHAYKYEQWVGGAAALAGAAFASACLGPIWTMQALWRWSAGRRDDAVMSRGFE